MIIIYGLVAAIAFIVFLGVAQHLGAGPLIAAIRARGANWRDSLWIGLQEVHFGHIIPGMKRLGWALLGFYTLPVVAALHWSIAYDYSWWLPFILLITALAGGVWTGWNNRRSHAEFSIEAMFSSGFVTLFLLGAEVFTAAHVFHQGHVNAVSSVDDRSIQLMDHAIASLGAAYVMMAFNLMATCLKALTLLMAYGVYMTEGTINTLLKGLIAFVPDSIGKKLKEILPPGGAVIAVEERWSWLVNDMLRQIKNPIYTVLAFGIAAVHPYVTGFAMVYGMAREYFWGQVEGNGIDITQRRRDSALSTEKLNYVFWAIALVTIFVPGASAHFDVLWGTICLYFTKLITGGNEAFTSGMKWLVGGTLAGAVAIMSIKLWPRDVNDQNRRIAPFTRWLTTTAFAIITLACMVGFVWAQIGAPVMSTVTAATDGVLLKFIPQVDGTQAPGAKVTWPTVPDAVGYRIERRELHESVYATLKDSAGNDRLFSRGVTAFEDTDVMREKTYFYRINALTLTGSLESKETQVTIPKEPIKPTPGSTSAPSPTSPAQADSPRSVLAKGPCTDCGIRSNPGISAYCLDHPDDTEVCPK